MKNVAVNAVEGDGEPPDVDRVEEWRHVQRDTCELQHIHEYMFEGTFSFSLLFFIYMIFRSCANALLYAFTGCYCYITRWREILENT